MFKIIKTNLKFFITKKIANIFITNRYLKIVESNKIKETKFGLELVRECVLSNTLMLYSYTSITPHHYNGAQLLKPELNRRNCQLKWHGKQNKKLKIKLKWKQHRANEYQERKIYTDCVYWEFWLCACQQSKAIAFYKSYGKGNQK